MYVLFISFKMHSVELGCSKVLHCSTTVISRQHEQHKQCRIFITMTGIIHDIIMRTLLKYNGVSLVAVFLHVVA